MSDKDPKFPKQTIKLKEINWSPFLVKFLSSYIFWSIVPHFLFWIPYWLQLPPFNLDLGWELNGDPALPSRLLTYFYLMFGTAFLFFFLVLFDYKFNRQTIRTKSKQFEYEPIRIPIGGGHFLEGDLVKGPATLKENAPVMILCHGLGSVRWRVYHYGLAMTYLGFAIVFYDSRGHGQTSFGKKYDTLYIIRDINRVVDYIQDRGETIGDVNPKEIVAWGESMGGGIVLNEGYLDHRIKFVIALATWADYQKTATRRMSTITEKMVKAGYEMQGINLLPSGLQNRLVSPVLNSFNKKKGFFDHPVYWDVDNNYRVMIAHCRDDEFINHENFKQNIDFLQLNPENYIFFEQGNHKFSHGETAIVGKMLFWFWQRGY